MPLVLYSTGRGRRHAPSALKRVGILSVICLTLTVLGLTSAVFTPQTFPTEMPNGKQTLKRRSTVAPLGHSPTDAQVIRFESTNVPHGAPLQVDSLTPETGDLAAQIFEEATANGIEIHPSLRLEHSHVEGLNIRATASIPKGVALMKTPMKLLESHEKNALHWVRWKLCELGELFDEDYEIFMKGVSPLGSSDASTLCTKALMQWMNKPSKRNVQTDNSDPIEWKSPPWSLLKGAPGWINMTKWLTSAMRTTRRIATPSRLPLATAARCLSNYSMSLLKKSRDGSQRGTTDVELFFSTRKFSDAGLVPIIDFYSCDTRKHHNVDYGWHPRQPRISPKTGYAKDMAANENVTWAAKTLRTIAPSDSLTVNYGAYHVVHQVYHYGFIDPESSVPLPGIKFSNVKDWHPQARSKCQKKVRKFSYINLTNLEPSGTLKRCIAMDLVFTQPATDGMKTQEDRRQAQIELYNKRDWSHEVIDGTPLTAKIQSYIRRHIEETVLPTYFIGDVAAKSSLLAAAAMRQGNKGEIYDQQCREALAELPMPAKRREVLQRAVVLTRQAHYVVEQTLRKMTAV